MAENYPPIPDVLIAPARGREDGAACVVALRAGGFVRLAAGRNAGRIGHPHFGLSQRRHHPRLVECRRWIAGPSFRR
jgi:hypothetical protein